MIRRILLYPDIHYPRHNPEAIAAVFQFTKWFKPHTIVLVGDALEMDAINQWKMSRGDNKHFEGKRLLKEYEGFDREILTPLEKMTPKGCEKIYLGGNHEVWADMLISKFPTLKGMIEPDICLKLKERNWKWIPYIVPDKDGGIKQGLCQFGKLLVTHGQYSNKYHAAKVADMYSKSVAYGHVHDIQFYTKVFSDNASGYHSAQSIGCLCNTSPRFLRGKGNRWVNAFGVLYVQDDGYYNLYTPVIVKGKFVFAGKLFNGK